MRLYDGDGNELLIESENLEETKLYLPGFWIRNRFIQSFLASNHLGAGKKLLKAANSQTYVIKTCEDSYLGCIVDMPQRPQGLIILLHGWEGHSQSAYILKTGQYFFSHGYAIARLNMRDHGGTASWNEGPFHGNRFVETYDAIMQIQKKVAGLPTLLCGFSLGGNFVARIAIHNSRLANDEIQQYLAISPSLQPYIATAMIDRHPVLKRYFLRSWKDSLYLKHYFFPQTYPTTDFARARSVMQLTEKLVVKYTDYSSLQQYFTDYTLEESHFANLQVALTILSSRDDPIIPGETLSKLQNNPAVNVLLTNYGGHNGFLPGLRGENPYYIYVMEDLLKKIKKIP